MKGKPARTLADMANEAATGSLECPKCGCRHLETYGGRKGQSSDTRTRYRRCRNPKCRHSFLTSLQTVERIIRDVDTHGDDDEGPEVMILPAG